MSGTSSSAPRATYRVQLREGMTFERATGLLPYLDALGVSHVYCSPCMEARSGSAHGYDVVDPTRVDPALGGEEAFESFAEALRARGMGLVLDWVPNHVGIANGENAWWQDVLEHGRASPYADFFDVNWEPARPALRGKLLLPVLARHYGAVLEAGELEPVWNESTGLEVHYFEHRFPVSPASTAAFLRERLRGSDDEGAPALPAARREALEAVLAKLLSAGDPRPGKRALLDLVREDPGIRTAVERAVDSLRGRPDVPRSHDALHRLLDRQHYRLAYWRVAAEEVNYRRFFDIDELAALRMERREVFDRTHEWVLTAMAAGRVAGLRIDHVDGLSDPRGYCSRLRQRRPGLYLVVEKILEREERLREDWPVDGTTGYDFLHQLNDLFVDPRAAGPLERLQRRFGGDPRSFDEILYGSRRRVMHTLLAGELESLASRLDRIAQQDRFTRDYTRSALRDALEEIVARFPVYRTYVDERGAGSEDRRHIHQAVSEAQRRADDPGSGIFDWIERVLTGDVAATTSPARREEVLRFVARFQQYTAPVMAKGLEDTSFYRYHRLVSLNEVGGDPRRFGSPEGDFHFHAANRERALRWPAAMLCTASHDGKRGEDTRARIDVLSELPDAWAERVREWSKRNRRFKRRLHGSPAPARKDEYLLYQVLVGTWPVPPPDDAQLAGYRERIQSYMTKALREGKERSSWRHPDSAYEASMSGFVEALLDPASGFLEQARPFFERTAELGALNGLAATALKLCSPGVPDVYQGCELWDLSLADPDNRRPVDFDGRRRALASLEKELGDFGAEPPPPRLRELLQAWPDGRIKLYLTWRLLALRRTRPELFAHADYLPLRGRGEHATRLCAFARRHEDAALLVAAPRLSAGLKRTETIFPLGRESWGDTEIVLPPELPGEWRDVLTGRTVRAHAGAIPAADGFAVLPVAAWIPASGGRP